jgi:hypothetical protein
MMYKIGSKVAAWWGAMMPYSYGKIIEWNPDDSMKFVVEWSDGSKFHGKMSDIHYGEIQSAGIGLYFADGYDWPNEWFEKEEAA